MTVLDPTGARAKFAKGKERMFEPVHDLAQLIGNGPTFLPLPPQEDVPGSGELARSLTCPLRHLSRQLRREGSLPGHHRLLEHGGGHGGETALTPAAVRKEAVRGDRETG